MFRKISTWADSQLVNSASCVAWYGYRNIQNVFIYTERCDRMVTGGKQNEECLYDWFQGAGDKNH